MPDKTNGNTILPPVPPQAPDVPATVSLCVICGDEGADGIARLLQSVLERDAGPMFDEVSVYWNGSAEKKPAILCKSTWTTRHGFEVPLIVKDGPWRKDFAWARQISFEQATGIWRCYLDSDDIVAAPEAEAVDQSLRMMGRTRAEGVAAAATIRDFLKDLPSQANAIWAPYFYAEIEGRPAVVTPRCRIVRWADGWCWANAVHEDILPINANAPRIVMHNGFVVQHRPLHPSATRVDRNAEILFTLEQQAGGPDKLDHRTLYGIATVHFDRMNHAGATEYLMRALQAMPGPPPSDAVIYRTMLAQARCRAGVPNEALEHAMWAVLALPDSPLGYLELGRAYLLNGNYTESARWFREGFKRREALMDLTQHPMTIQGQLRAMGAHALINIGAFDEALQWAEEAVKADPGLLPERTLDLCRATIARKRVSDAFAVLRDHLILHGEVQQLIALRHACPAVLETDNHAYALVARVDHEIAKGDPAPTDATETPSSALLEVLNLPKDARVVSSDLVRALDPSNVLARAEHGQEIVHVIVPDSARPIPRQPADARASFTRERILRLLSTRGAVTDLRSARLPTQDHMDRESYIRASYIPGPRPTPKTVALWCQHYAQSWGPDDPETKGTGGSEEAVVHLSRALVERGYDVTVFGPLPPPHDAPLRVYHGVVWRELRALDPGMPFDHLIFHRAPATAQVTSFASKNLWSWHHDHFYSEEYWNRRTVSTTRHLYVSRWQRRVLEDLVGQPTRGRVIFNGIPPTQFETAEAHVKLRGGKRNPHTVAYASMPTRGLDRLLTLWPDVTAQIPDAKLLIYYGMHTARQLWRGPYYDPFPLLLQMEADIKALGTSGGVVFRGRVGQLDLTEEFLQIGALAYPSAFPEVYMIAGVRAAAAGMKLVTTDTAALPEIMPDTSYMVPHAIEQADWDSRGRAVFTDTLIRALTEPEDAYDRDAVAARTRRVCSWEGVARRVADSFDAAERGDEAFFQSDVTTETRHVPDGPADMRVPTGQAVEALRKETMALRFI